MKQLIIAADDFGTSHTANTTIEALYKAGRITTAGIVVNTPYSADAVFRVLGLGMNVGIQWRLPPVTEEIDSTMVMFELEQQISFLTDHGLHPDHATNPSRTLMNYMGQNFMTEVFMICGGHNIPYRMPQSTFQLLPAMSPGVIEFMEANGMLLAPMLESAWLFSVKLPKTVTNTRAYLTIDSYEQLKEGCLKILGVLPDGISVLHLNPCEESDESKNAYKDWQKRAWEAQLLNDPDFLSAIRGFELADYTKAFENDIYPDVLV